jgi:hypothetical protein
MAWRRRSGASRRTRIAPAIAIFASLSVLLSGGSVSALVPGLWSVPVPGVNGNGFLWLPAPPDGSLDNLALRTETEWPPLINPGALFLVTVPFYSGIVSVDMPLGMKISDITQLSLDTYYESGVGCGGGSPRAQLAIDTDGDLLADANVHVYGGPFPGYAGCPSGLWASNNLLDGSARFDTGQLAGGTFYDTQANADALAGADHQVVRVAFVWDSPWVNPDVTSVVWFDNMRVNDFFLGEPVVDHACSLALGITGGPVCP